MQKKDAKLILRPFVKERGIDMDLKKKVIESSPLVKSLYKTADNPIFEIFYLEDAKAIIADSSGNAPKEFNL